MKDITRTEYSSGESIDDIDEDKKRLLRKISIRQIDISYNKFTQVFNNKELEREFLENYYYTKNRYIFRYPTFKMGVLVGLMVWIYFLYTDFSKTSHYKLYMIIIRCISLAGQIVNIILMFLPVKLILYHEICATAHTVNMASCVVLLSNMMLDVQKAMPFASMLGILVCYVLPRMRIIFAILLAVFTIVVQFASLFGFYSAEAIETIELSLTHCLMIFITNIIGFVQLYTLERYFRRNFVLMKQSELNTQILAKEQVRYQKLLENILPAHYIATVKKFPNFIKYYKNVTILFSDIVHFTEYASKATVEEVVTMLNAQYSRFDSIANNLNIEKIKTIGDAYFAIEGLKGYNSVVNMVEMGNRMLEAVNMLNKKHGWEIQMRIGIHSGSAIAAVIGGDKLTFDVYGNDVILANMLEAAGVPNRVHVSQPVYDATCNIFKYEARGLIEIAGFGFLNTFLLVPSEKNTNEDSIALPQNPMDEARLRSTSVSLASKKLFNPEHELSNIAKLKELTNDEQNDDDEIAYTIPLLNIFKTFNTFKWYSKSIYKGAVSQFRVVTPQIVLMQLTLLTIILANFREKALRPEVIVSYVFAGIQLLVLIISFVFHKLIQRYMAIGLTLKFGVALLCFATTICVSIDDTLIANCMGISYMFTLVVFNNTLMIPFIVKLVLSTIGTILVCVYSFIVGDTSYSLVVASYVLLLLAGYFVEKNLQSSFILQQQIENKSKKIEKERRKNEKLILSAIPKSILERLQTNPTKVFDVIEEGSVCFVKLVNPDQNCADERFIGTLNHLFTKFDETLPKYQCEKIKSIGSVYIAVCGVPHFVKNHASMICHAALEFQKTAEAILTPMNRRLQENESTKKEEWHIQIGIHSGSFAAGILGELKFLYDIFGDTVNVASRMMTSAKPNQIQISDATYNLIKDEFITEERGSIPIKGKNEMTVHTLVNAIGCD